jgi:hypothetical protein
MPLFLLREKILKGEKELFDKETLLNLLPSDGESIYFGKVFTCKESQYYLGKLLKNIAWKNDEVIIFEKK